MRFSSPKTPWADRFPDGKPRHVSLARLVESDGARDEAEVECYEEASDPAARALERRRRSFRGQLERRLRRMAHEGDTRGTRRTA